MTISILFYRIVTEKTYRYRNMKKTVIFDHNYVKFYYYIYIFNITITKKVLIISCKNG